MWAACIRFLVWIWKSSVRGSRDNLTSNQSVSPAEKRISSAGISAKTSIWWDIDDCCPPPGVNPMDISRRMNDFLRENGVSGPSVASAYGDAHRLSADVQRALSNTGINLHHFVSGPKDASQKAILVDLAFWSKENPPPANIVLISGDDSFSVILHQLRMQGFRVFLIRPHHSSCVAESLLNAATSIWQWETIVQGCPKVWKNPSLAATKKRPGDGAGSRTKDYHGRPLVRGALTTLRTEMLPSTEENIHRCIASSTGVATFNLPEALDNGVSCGDLKLTLIARGTVKLYIPADEQAWYFINTAANREYVPQVWDGLRNFLRSKWLPLTFVRSSNIYEAALAIRQSGNVPLSTLSLGQLCNLLHLAAVEKLWIKPHPQNWSPLTILVNQKAPSAPPIKCLLQSSARSHLPRETVLNELQAWLPSKLTPHGYNISNIKSDFEKERGVALDYRSLGFEKCSDLVRQLPGIVELRASKIYPPKPSKTKTRTSRRKRKPRNV